MITADEMENSSRLRPAAQIYCCYLISHEPAWVPLLDPQTLLLPVDGERSQLLPGQIRQSVTKGVIFTPVRRRTEYRITIECGPKD
jgi:hypothetical protein